MKFDAERCNADPEFRRVANSVSDLPKALSLAGSDDRVVRAVLQCVKADYSFTDQVWERRERRLAVTAAISTFQWAWKNQVLSCTYEERDRYISLAHRCLFLREYGTSDEQARCADNHFYGPLSDGNSPWRNVIGVACGSCSTELITNAISSLQSSRAFYVFAKEYAREFNRANL